MGVRTATRGRLVITLCTEIVYLNPSSGLRDDPIPAVPGGPKAQGVLRDPKGIHRIPKEIVENSCSIDIKTSL